MRRGAMWLRAWWFRLSPEMRPVIVSVGVFIAFIEFVGVSDHMRQAPWTAYRFERGRYSDTTAKWERMIGAAHKEDPAYYGRFDTMEACDNHIMGHARTTSSTSLSPSGWSSWWTHKRENGMVVLDSWILMDGDRSLLLRIWMECRPPQSWFPKTPEVVGLILDGWASGAEE